MHKLSLGEPLQTSFHVISLENYVPYQGLLFEYDSILQINFFIGNHVGWIGIYIIHNTIQASYKKKYIYIYIHILTRLN